MLKMPRILKINDEQKFYTSIFLGVLLTILATVTISLIAMKTLGSINKSKDIVTFLHTQDLLSAKDLQTELVTRTALDRAYLLTGNTLFLNDLEVARSRFNNTLNNIHHQVQTAESHAQLDLIDGLQKEMLPIADQALKLRQSKGGQTEVVKFFENRLFPAREKLEKAVNQLFDMSTKRFNEARNQATITAEKILTLFKLMTAIAIALAIGLALLLSRTLVLLFRRLKNSEALKTSMMDSALDAILAIDHRGCILEFNPAAEKIFKFSKSQAIGYEMANLILPPDLRDAHRRGLAHYLTTGIGPILNKRVEMRALRSTGEEFQIEVSVTRHQGTGLPKFTGFLRDITEQKGIEAERLEAIQSRNEFVAIVSHELRNPLTAISNGIELIRRAISVEQRQGAVGKSIERLQTAAKRMGRLTSDLLDVSRLESGHIILTKDPMTIESLIEEAIEIYQPLAYEKNIRIETDLAPDCPLVLCDRDRLVQVLGNLLHNALKFTGQGGTVGIKTVCVNGDLEIQVKDTGSGIPEDQIQRVFDRFWQAKASAHQGTGLGLSIAKGIIEAHGGRIWVESKEGQGSTFSFRLQGLKAKKQAS